VLLGQLAQLLDRHRKKLGVGGMGNILGLHRGVHGDTSQIVLLQGTCVVRDTQAFLRQNVQFVADAVTLMAHAGTHVGRSVLQNEHADYEAHRLRRAFFLEKCSPVANSARFSRSSPPKPEVPNGLSSFSQTAK
jgi:hypothetical protein